MSQAAFTLDAYGITPQILIRNAVPAKLYAEALRYEPDAAISDQGALIVKSYAKTGRSPKDKRIVEGEASKPDIWWGDINIPLDDHTFLINRTRAIDYLNLQERVYVVDGFAGWDPRYRLKVRVITTRPYHALFMHNMLMRPSPAELSDFSDPDYVIFNAGRFPANRMTSFAPSRAQTTTRSSRTLTRIQRSAV